MVNTAAKDYHIPVRTNNRIWAQTVRTTEYRPSRIMASRLLMGTLQTDCQTQLAWIGQVIDIFGDFTLNILYSDESRFCLRFSNGRHRVYQRIGERFTRVLQKRKRCGVGRNVVLDTHNWRGGMSCWTHIIEV